MENIVFLAAMVVFVLGVFLYAQYNDHQIRKQFRSKLLKRVGQAANKEIKVERFERIGGYLNKHPQEDALDEITWNDLSLDEVFHKLDYTASSTGEEYLYYLLHTPQSEEELQAFEEKVDYFQKHVEERVELELLFHQLGATGKYSLYDYLDFLDNLGKKTTLQIAASNLIYIPGVVLLFWNTPLGIVAVVAAMLFQMFRYMSEKNVIEPYLISFSYISRMYAIGKKMVKLEIPVIQESLEHMKGYLKNISVSQVGQGVVFSQSGPIAGSNPLEILYDYIKACFHIDLLFFYHMLSQVRKSIPEIDGLIGEMGNLEAAMSVALYRAYLEAEGQVYTTPVFEGEELCLKEGYHPLLSHPVTNSITAHRGVLLTGSNASGKSTFLKTVALSATLAQTIHTVTASAYQAPMYRIFSSMSLKDHIESGESYFIVEIKAMKRIIDSRPKQGEKKVICFVDEVLRGTNTVERIAAAYQILLSLQGEGITCFAATHDLELADMLSHAYDNYHFEEEMRDQDVTFSYEIKEGKATTRNAIKLLRVLNYDENLVENAEHIADEFIKTGVWKAR